MYKKSTLFLLIKLRLVVVEEQDEKEKTKCKTPEKKKKNAIGSKNACNSHLISISWKTNDVIYG